MPPSKSYARSESDLVQSMLHWENAVANRAMFAEKLAALKDPTDLIVLPEMFTTGFTMNTGLAETMDGATVAWMREQADRTEAAIYGSVIIEEGGIGIQSWPIRYTQRRVTTTTSDTSFVSRMRTTISHAGTERVVVEWRGWRILLQICFDLRFPVFARNRQTVQGRLRCDPIRRELARCTQLPVEPTADRTGH